MPGNNQRKDVYERPTIEIVLSERVFTLSVSGAGGNTMDFENGWN